MLIERLILVNKTAKPIDIMIIQLHIETTDHGEEEIAIVYDEISDILLHKRKMPSERHSNGRFTQH